MNRTPQHECGGRRGGHLVTQGPAACSSDTVSPPSLRSHSVKSRINEFLFSLTDPIDYVIRHRDRGGGSRKQAAGEREAYPHVQRHGRNDTNGPTGMAFRLITMHSEVRAARPAGVLRWHCGAHFGAD